MNKVKQYHEKQQNQLKQQMRRQVEQKSMYIICSKHYRTDNRNNKEEYKCMIFYKNDYANELEALTGLYKQTCGSGTQRKYELICRYLLSVKQKQNLPQFQQKVVNQTIAMFDTFSNMANIVTNSIKQINIIDCKILGMIQIHSFSVEKFVEEYKNISKDLFGGKFIQKQGQLHPNNAIKYRKEYARAKNQKMTRKKSCSKSGSDYDSSDKSVEIIPKKEQINKKFHEIPSKVITESTKKKLQLISSSQQSNEQQIDKIQRQRDKIEIEQKNSLDQKLSKKKIQIIKRSKLAPPEILSESKQKQKQKQKKQRRRRNKVKTKQKLKQPIMLISIEEADKCEQASNKKKSGHGNQLKLNPIKQLLNRKIQKDVQDQQPTTQKILKQQPQKQKKQNENINPQINLMEKLSKVNKEQIDQQQSQKIQEEQEQTKIIRFLALSNNSQSLSSNRIGSVSSVDMKNISTINNNGSNMNNNKESTSLSNTVPNPAKSRSKKNKKNQPPPNNMRLDQFFKK